MADPYFTVDELRVQDTALQNETKYTDARLDEMRQLVEQAIEEAAEVAFVPREYTETLSGRGTQRVFTRWARLRSVTAAALDGVAVDVTPLRVTRRVIYRPPPDRWPAGVANVTVTYLHGWDAPPLRVKRAALILAKNWLLKGPIDDRATQIRDGDTGGLITLATPGVRGANFGIPEVDAVVADYAEPAPPHVGLD